MTKELTQTAGEPKKTADCQAVKDARANTKKHLEFHRKMMGEPIETLLEFPADSPVGTMLQDLYAERDRLKEDKDNLLHMLSSWQREEALWVEREEQLCLDLATAKERIKELERFVKEWGDRFGFLSKNFARDSFDSIDDVACLLNRKNEAPK